MFSPGEFTFENELLSQMRRWSVLSLLDDALRQCSEILVYRTDDYFNSWWTIGELICAAYIRQGQNIQKHISPIRIRIYDPLTNQVIEEDNTLDVQFSEVQMNRLSRLFSNSRPDTMGPENPFRSGLINMIYDSGLGEEYFEFMRNLSNDKIFLEIITSLFPSSMDPKEKERIIDDIKELYSDPDKIKDYMNDEVFSESFWKVPSVQLSTHFFYQVDSGIDIENFFSAPKEDELPFTMEQLADAAEKGTPLTFSEDGKKDTKYLIKMLPPRYLWKPVRLGFDTGTDSPALESLPTYIIERLS